jgi:ankyrin repeat protein
MLDPLSALGLAGNLVQVIQFSYDIVSEGNKIYKDASGVLTQNKAIEEVSSDLANLTENLKTKQEEWRVAHGRSSLDAEEILLRNLCDRCVEVAFELQIQLNKLKAKEGRTKRLRSYKQALIAIWRKDEVEELEKRLKRYQKELDTRVLIGIRQNLLDANVKSSEQFAALNQQAKDLAVTVLDHNGNFDTKLDHHTDVLAQIAAGQIKTNELLKVVVGVAGKSPPTLPGGEQMTVDPSNDAAEKMVSALHKASAIGETTKVRQLLRDTSLDVNARDEHGCTALHLAMNADTARYLLRDKRIDHGAEDYMGRTALHYAVLRRRLDVIKALLDSSVDKEWQDDMGKTASFYSQACLGAMFMLRYGTDVEAKSTDNLHNTGLLHLAWLGDKEGVEYYLSQGALVNARNDSGETALTESARHGYVQIVELLLRHGANTEIAAGDEWTPLLQAIRDGREAVVRVLLQHGAKKRARLASGNSTVAEACWRKHFGIARLLIEAGSSVDTRDLQKATPLLRASLEGDVEFVRWALQKGADPNAKNDASLTPLYVACEKGYSAIAVLLLEAGASHRTQILQSNWTPLGIAARRGRNGCVKALLQYGACPNLKGHAQYTPPAEACYHGHPRMLKHFIAAKADLEARNSSGFTLLGVAAYRGQDACIRNLLEAGAKLEVKADYDLTPLMCAARWNHPSSISLLVQYGANIEARNRGGMTSLMVAVDYQYTETVRELIKHGADVNASLDSGHTALHAAALSGNETIVKMLIDAKANIEARDSFGRTPGILAVHHHKDDLLKGLLGPDASKEEFLRELQRNNHPSDIAKHMNKMYQG